MRDDKEPMSHIEELGQTAMLALVEFFAASETSEAEFVCGELKLTIVAEIIEEDI